MREGSGDIDHSEKEHERQFTPSISLKIKARGSLLKVAFSQKGLMGLSFLQTDEPNYFPKLKVR